MALRRAIIWLQALLLVAGLASTGSLDSHPSIAILNEVPYHLEIVIGIIHVLRDYPLTVYVNKEALRGGLLDMSFQPYVEGMEYKVPIKPLPELGQAPRHDVVIAVSPEFKPAYTQSFIAAAQPKLVGGQRYQCA